VNLLIPPHTWHETWLRVLDKWGDDGVEFLRRDVPKIVGVLIIAFVLTRLLKLISNHLNEVSKREGLPSNVRAQQLRTLSGVVHGVGMFLIVFVAAMQILPVLGINMGPILASAGVVGLAIGFGAQTLVKDVINGFFILIENQYDVGDTVKIGSVQGTVEMMTLRCTILRDADGTVHTIPNSTIAVVSNLTRDWTLVALHVSADYQEDSDRIMSLLKEVAEEVRNEEGYKDLLVADPQVHGIERVHGTEVEYLLTVKTRPGQQYSVTRELRLRIKQCFEKNGIRPGGQSPYFVMESKLPVGK
jgi:moderate conductance mechanosensitive channel